MRFKPEDINAVPVPLAQRLNDFRLQVIPVLVFCVTLASIVSLWESEVAPPTVQDDDGVAGESATNMNILAGPDQATAPRESAPGTIVSHPVPVHGYRAHR